MLMSLFPDKRCDWEQGWTMKQICDQNDIDRPHPNKPHYRKILTDIEAQVFDNQDKKNVQQHLSTVFKDVIGPQKLPEMMKIDRTEPDFIFRFLQSIYTNYLDHVKKNNGNLVTPFSI